MGRLRDAAGSWEGPSPLSRDSGGWAELDRYVSPNVRTVIEETYYTRVNERGSLDELSRDAAFLLEPGNHIAFFSDHGVVHVRDVAARVLRVLDRIHGVLLPPRSPARLDFMRGYGILTAYVHDIGMADFSPFGRTVHPEAAAQTVFDHSFDPVINRMWEEDSGSVRSRILSLTSAGELEGDPRTVVRELLAMAACHSKRTASADTLADRARLRRAMQKAISTHLHETYQRRTGADETPDTAEGRSVPNLRRFYRDMERESFLWLAGGSDRVEALVDDVVDALHALRCADALRQRGSTLRTSGTYQLFIDQLTGYAICSLERDATVWFVELDDPMAAGEANLAGSELDADGNLWISFHHGSFASPDATARAVKSAAQVIDDVQADIVPTLADRWPQRPGNRSGPFIIIEHVDDNPDFAQLVADELQARNPAIAPILRLAPSLARAAERERRRYLDASGAEFPPEYVDELLQESARAGQRIDHLDRVAAFDGVRLTVVDAGEVVMTAGELAGFVYIPLDSGLRVEPVGGYPPRRLPAWSPVGTSAVIGGATRNGTVIAEQTVGILMIPRDTYLRHWYRPYSIEEFMQRALDGPS
jgi:hypothetical protein